MSRQTAISNVNKRYLEDQEQGITHEHYSAVDTANRMLEDYKRRQKEREEEERKRRQEWLNQRSARASQDIAREAEGILQTRREAETEPVTAPRSRRENSDDYYFGDSTGTRHLGSGRDLGKLAITGNTSGKRRMEYDRNQEKLKEYEGVSSQQLYTQADLAQQTARSAQMERNRMASELAANPGLIFNQEFTQGLSGATARADATEQAASRATDKFNTVAELRRKVDEQSNYGYLNQNPDYAKYSSGDEETAKRANNSLSPKMIRYYNIYNRGKIQSGVTSGAPAEAYVTDDEAGRYFYLWAKQGADAAEAYYNTYVKDRAQERRTNKERQNVQDLATSSPVMSAAMSAASVPLQATGIIGMIDLTIQNAERRIGINADKPINYNTAWQAPSDQASAIRESVSNKIQTDVTKNLLESGHSEKTANWWGAAASFAYQTGMSMADSGVQALLVRVGIPEAATLTLMAGGAGMSSIREAKQRGASDGEALAYGYAAAFAEGIFEHVSLENLMTAKTPRKFWQGVKEVAKQSFAEGSEEFATTYANTLTDMFINGGASEISQNVLSYMADGLSEKEARKTAAIHWLKNITMDFLGGAISGGAMGAGNVGVNLALNYAQDFQTGRAINDALRQEQAAPVQEQTPRVPAPQAPALTISTQETQNARRTDPLGYALEKIGNGETLTGGDARAILENPQAVQSLRDAGVLTEAVKSGNEGRKQINAAVAALAEQNRAVTTDLQQETERNPQPRVQNQQETAQERTAPPMPEQRQAETPVPQIPAEGRLRVREQTETPLLPSRLTVRAENGTLRENRQEDINGQETETSASAGEEDFKSRAAATAEGARRSYLDRIERSSGVGRLLADLRTTQAVRGARNRASEVSRIRNATEAGNQREVSAQDYGIANGTDEKSARELGSATASRILGRDWDRAVAELSQRGVTLKAMTGQLQKADGNQVRAFFSGDGKTIVVQVDHPTLSWNQLLDHEELHRRIQEDTEYRKAVEDALLSDKKLRAYLPEIIDRYAQAYSRADSTLSSDAVIEEMLADYRAGFDMLDPLGIQTPEYGRAAKRAARDIRAVEKGRESKVGVNVDTGSESANPDSYSIETWNASDYVLNRTAAASDLARQLNVSDQQAMKYIDDVNSIAKIIANDRTRLDYTPSPGRSSFIGNTEYGGSIDFSTICKKRRLYTGTIESIQKALPNTAITADELLAIRNMMKERGYEVSCGLCYVEGSRVKLGEYTQQFLNELKGTGMYVPTMAEMNTSDGQEQLRAEHPEVYDAYVKFMNKLAQRKPKLFQMATEYQGEILKKFKNDGTVDQKNRNGGLRLQSFSDFEIIHLIDTMQVITDMGRVGLAGQAYTKVPDFAWALGNTGLKINLSLIAKGVDENGRIILDEVEGMKRSDAEELRNAYSKNVGTILVTFNDEQLKAAMADPFVDFIIPFHRSQWSKSQYETIGLPANAKDYTDQQNEAYIDKVYNANGKPQRPSNYMPNNYWDFSKTGKENAETYLRMCAENNRRPKFYKLLVDNGDGSYSLQKDGSTDGYWKLLSDYKMYDNEGKGSPQVPVQPKFNMEQAERMLNEYTGGHQRFPVAQDVVDDFLKGKQGKASTEIGDEFQRIFTGEVRTAKGVKLERKEYSAVSHALKTGYGQFDNDGLGGTVNTEDFCYYFDTFSDGSVVISKRIRHERLNIHQERLEEKHGSESRDNRSTGGVDVQRRNGQENGTQRVGDDGRGGEYAVSDSLDRKEQTDIGRDSEEGEGNPAQRSSLIEKASTEISEEDLDEAVYEKMSASMRDIMRRLQEDIDRAKEPEQKPEPKKKVQRASDEEYMAAMDNGRIADAQRLVRETADASMPDSKVRSASTGELRYVYHYTNKNFFEFKRKGASPGSSRTHGDGYYVSPSETAYSSFGRNKMTLFANITAPFEMELTEAQAQAVYDKYFRPLHPNDLGGTYESHVMSKLQTASRVFDYLKEAAEKNNTTTSAILSELGFDGVHDGSIWVAFDSEQLKSADVATYTDDGQIIPLSERFNPEKKDTRYSIEIDPDVAAQFSPEAIALRQSNRTKGAKGERKVSRVRSNTYEYSGLFNEVEAQMDEADEENYTYDPVSEKKSMNEALGRLKADFDGEVSRLSEADKQWGGSDLDTAMGILHRYRTEGRATGNYTDFWNWSKTIQEKGTKGGQFIQAFAKYTRTGTGAAMKGAKDIHDRFKLNPAQQKQVDAAKKKLMDGIDGDMNGAAQDAMKQAKGQKEPGKKQDGKVDKKKLDAEVQRRKDAEQLVREISKLFEKQQNHGEPVENWLSLTGEELARKIAGRFSEPKQRTKTTMQTILSDLVGFAEEHALPDRKKAEGAKRTAIDSITDYLNNRDAYGTAWAAAQSYLRAAYTDDQEKLDALNGFLTATIAYNAEGTDRTMLDAILQSADVLGISEKRILELTSAGATASTIDRIGDELVSQVKERMGADYDESFTQQLKDAVRRHITGIALQESSEEQRLRLGGMTTDAARQLEINLQKLLTQSRGDKNKAAQSVADYLIRELGIPSSDAAIAAERITGAFTDELAIRADRKLQQMFAEKKPKTQEQRDKLLDLIRLGGLTNSNVEDAVVDALGIGGMSRERQRELVGAMAQFGETLDAMEADDLDGLKDLIRAQAAVRNTPLSRQAEKALAGETDAQYLREFALAQLDAIAGDFAEMSPGAKISTFQTISHLLNMRTALRNLTSNQVFDLVDSAATNLATIPDMVIGAITGKRTVGVNRSWLSEMKRAGAKQGAGRNLLEVRLDVSPDDRQKSKYGTAGRRTNSMANSNAFGRILSHLEEAMGYELNTTDEFHKGSVRGETLESLARFVERGDITQEQANAWAEEEALYRSFQDDTLVGNIMGELKTLLNVIGFGDSGKKNSRGRTIHDFGLGDLVVKYTQVPGALIHRGIEYSPLGYAKMVYDLAIAKDSLVRTQKRGEDVASAQRKLALDIGRATTGTGLVTLFAVLAKAGLLRRDDDDKDKNAKAMHAAQGLSGTQLNVTALGRWIGGEDADPQDGDVLADIGFLEPLDSLMTIATLLANDKDLSLSDIGTKSLDGIWKAISNTSAMQTISNIIQTVQYHDEENDLPLYFQIPIEIASDSISGFIPSPVRQLAQATDTTYRDQYRSRNVNDQIRAKAANSIPGVRQMLAPKITPLGEDKKYQKPLLNYLNATLNPGNVSVYQSSKVVDELNRVYGETEDAKIWPERNAPYSFTANDEKWTLTPDERTQYQRTRGQNTAKIMEDVMGTDWYKAMDGTAQAEVLNWIGNFSNFIAKKEMLEARGVDYGSATYDKYYSALAGGTPAADVVAGKYSKQVAAAEETAAAETIIAEAKIPEASREEAETMSAEGKRFYAGFLKGGVSDATARKLASELEGSEASGHEQWRMIYNSAGSEGEKAVTSVMTEDMKRNWELAKSVGVSMDDYIKVREDYLDLDGNGSQKQAEWNATLDQFTFSKNETEDKRIKGTLWQIVTGSGSTKNNPYDKEAGQTVIDAKGKGGGKGTGSNAPARIPTLRLPDIPKAEKPSSGLRIRAAAPAQAPRSGLRIRAK